MKCSDCDQAALFEMLEGDRREWKKKCPFHAVETASVEGSLHGVVNYRKINNEEFEHPNS